MPEVQVAITTYTLVMAAFMLTGAKLGDIWGRRRTFAIGLAIYGVGSLTTALSPNITVLIIGWSFVEGLGAVLVIPAIAALTAANYSGHERAVAFGLLGGISGAAAAAGPLIGGFVTTVLSWRVVFAARRSWSSASSRSCTSSATSAAPGTSGSTASAPASRRSGSA